MARLLEFPRHSSVEEFCKTCIKNFYYFGDFFVKWRFTRGKMIGMGKPVAALEAMENRYCRLATTRHDVASELVSYSDFKQVIVGRFAYGLTGYQVYPKFSSMRWTTTITLQSLITERNP